MKDLNTCPIEELIRDEIGMFLPHKCYGFCFDVSEAGKNYILQYKNMTDKDIINYIKKNQKHFNRDTFLLAAYLYLTKEIAIEGVDLTSRIPNKEEKIQNIKNCLRGKTAFYIDDADCAIQDRIYDSRTYLDPFSAIAKKEEAQVRVDEIEKN